MLTISGFQKALEYWQLFLQGVVCTVSLSALTVVLGFILALVLATCRMGRSRILRAISTADVGTLPCHANGGAGVHNILCGL
ncbi:MAG: hypothetical protein V8T45_05350 [Oscillospiraceae bacterium]